jgi:coatomer protein complex subunit gamma
MSDHMQKVLKPNWSALWEEIGVENEFEDNFTLSIPTLEGYFFYLYSFCFIIFFFLECVKKIVDYFGMQPCEQSDKVAENKIPHTLYLAGIHRGGHDVLVRVRMVSEGTSADYPSTTTTIQLTIRSTDKSAVQVIASVIAYVNKQ